MLFNEIYNVYYTAVGKLIEKAIKHELTTENAKEIIDSIAFSESFEYILDNIKSENWQVITKDFKTSIKHIPKPPITLLEKRFMKTISLDPRFKLFYKNKTTELLDIEPLYYPKDFYYFDKTSGSDPFEKPEYIKKFRSILRALKEQRRIFITFNASSVHRKNGAFIPEKLEFSAKDDKFKLICSDEDSCVSIELTHIKSIALLNPFDESDVIRHNHEECSVTLEITDEGNALSRALLHFASLKKETKHLLRDLYEMKISYYKDNEAEILISILSFGKAIKVTAPDAFVSRIKQRIYNQNNIVPITHHI